MTDEEKRCNTCKHETEPWVNGCSDCFDYELWEPKDEKERSDEGGTEGV